MASRMLGRADCPECGFKSAHVKESEKCVYRYCPECGSQHYAKTESQRSNLLKKTRLIEATSDATATGSEKVTAVAPTAKQEAAPVPTPRRHGLGLFQ